MNTLKTTKEPLKVKTLLLAIRVVNLHRYLTQSKKEFIISTQIMRSGTSPGAMVREAMNAESGHDFIHKLSVAQKETSETQYWLELLHQSGYLTIEEYNSLFNDCEEILKMLKSSILTKKTNLTKTKPTRP